MRLAFGLHGPPKSSRVYDLGAYQQLAHKFFGEKACKVIYGNEE